MHREPLERYIRYRLKTLGAPGIDGMKIARLARRDADGCNWFVAGIGIRRLDEIPGAVLFPILRDVKSTINLAGDPEDPPIARPRFWDLRQGGILEETGGSPFLLTETAVLGQAIGAGVALQGMMLDEVRHWLPRQYRGFLDAPDRTNGKVITALYLGFWQSFMQAWHGKQTDNRLRAHGKAAAMVSCPEDA